MDRRTLALAVPGLAGDPAWPALAQRLPRAPALGRLLACARQERISTDPGTIAARVFGLDGADLAVAALTRALDFDPAPAAHDAGWLRADPVYLHADRDRLLLFDAPAFDLGAEEAAALVAALDAHLAAIGLAVELGRCPARWYVRGPAAPGLRACSPAAAHGRHLGTVMPAGADAARWLRIGNELQMLLHAHPVNGARAARGAVPVNGVWFWGHGAMPTPPVPPPALACGDDALLEALARHLRVPFAPAWDHRALPAAAAWTALSAALRRDDFDAWAAALAVLERDWLQPALRALRRGHLRRLVVHTETRCLVLTAAGAWRPWPRPGLAASLRAMHA